MTSPWQNQFPERLGAMPFGGDLFRTDPAGSADAPVVFVGVHPSATEWKLFEAKGHPMKLPTAVERSCLEAVSAAGKEFDAAYLKPLGLRREDVLIVDLWPYFMANTRRESGRKSLAENIRDYEKATKTKTAIQPRPTANELLERVRKAPGNVDRLAEVLARKPRLVVTLGNEPAAFVRGLPSAIDAQAFLYGEIEELTVEALGLSAPFLHFAHPANGKPVWRETHKNWCFAKGRDLVQKALSRGEASESNGPRL